MKALAYLRRSKKSDSKTVSLDEQQRAVLEYASGHGLEIVDSIIDDGISGGKRERLTRIEAALKKNSCIVVVVYHLDRFARDVVALLDTLQHYHKAGLELHVVGKGKVSVDTSSNLLTVGVEALIGEYHKKLCGEKSKAALAMLRTQGKRYSGRLPYGSMLGADSQLLPCPLEQVTLKRILALVGFSARGVARILNSEGRKSRTGKPWNHNSIAGIQKRYR